MIKASDTPYSTEDCGDLAVICTCVCWSRYDINEASNVPPSLRATYSHCSNVAWSTLSNEADRLSNVSTGKLQIFHYINIMCNTTLSMAGSIEQQC